MKHLANIGRIFFGISIAIMGIVTVVDQAFPYMLIPPKLSWRPDYILLPIFFGALLAVAGSCIVFKKQTRRVSLLLGGLLALVFVLYYIPFQLMVTNYLDLKEWENAMKELDLACGAFIVAGFFMDKERSSFARYAAIAFAVTIACYGVFHFQLAESVAGYVPSWVPARLFFAYLAGAGLLASGVAIILKVKMELAAFLLGTMVFVWFAVLHVPRIVVSPAPYLASEIASACLALAYSGIAFMIADTGKSQKSS